MSDGNGNGLELKTAFGAITARGSNVMVALALAALTGVSMWEHYKRAVEHAHMECTLELTIYLQTLPKGAPITWHEVPAEYWPCLPKGALDRTTK